MACLIDVSGEKKLLGQREIFSAAIGTFALSHRIKMSTKSRDRFGITGTYIYSSDFYEQSQSKAMTIYKFSSRRF
jgi:hypothetical protein